MNYKEIKIKTEDFPQGFTSLSEFCYYVKNKNTVALHLIEEYTGKRLSEDKKLSEIRKIILDVSGDINRLPYNIFIEDDDNEKL